MENYNTNSTFANVYEIGISINEVSVDDDRLKVMGTHEHIHYYINVESFKPYKTRRNWYTVPGEEGSKPIMIFALVLQNHGHRSSRVAYSLIDMFA